MTTVTASPARKRQRGSISPLMIGFCVVLLMLALGTFGVSKAFLYQRELANDADGAALYAADAIDTGAIYAGGGRRLDPALVQQAVSRYMANRPAGAIPITSAVGVVTGADNLTAQVTVRASMPVPFVNSLFPSHVPISATASARGLG